MSFVPGFAGSSLERPATLAAVTLAAAVAVAVNSDPDPAFPTSLKAFPRSLWLAGGASGMGHWWMVGTAPFCMLRKRGTLSPASNGSGSLCLPSLLYCSLAQRFSFRLVWAWGGGLFRREELDFFNPKSPH